MLYHGGSKNRILTRNQLKILLSILISIVLLIIFYIGFIIHKETVDLQVTTERTIALANKFAKETKKEGTASVNGTDNSKTETKQKKTEITVDLKEVKKEIKDAVFWIKAPLMNVSEVVVQGKDNDYYLHYSPTQEKTILGSIFLDSQNDKNIEKNFINYIFGHTADDLNVRFSKMGAYFKRTKEEYIYLYQNDKEYTYRVMDAFRVEPTNTLYPVGLFSQDEYTFFKEALLENGANPTEVEKITKDGKYILLVTCQESWDNSKRKLVLGELIKETPYNNDSTANEKENNNDKE